jgi:hypothetical protein
MLVVGVVMVVGCGDEGVSGSKKITELSAAESKDVCQEFAGDYPERTVMCGPDVTFTIGFKDVDCNNIEPAPATCTATVGDARACNDAIYSMSDAELCGDGPTPPACAKLEDC